MGDAFALVARSLRGEYTESWHFGAVAVSDPEGRIVAHVGYPQQAAFLRSAAKPLQALTMLRLGLDSYELSADELALVCASHAGRERHVSAVAALLERAGLSAAALLCGAHAPLDQQAARLLGDAGCEPSALHNNCSGKHAGMLLTCRAADLSLGDYLSPSHPLQRAILEDLCAWCGLEPDAVGVATDGCGVPTFRVALAAGARALARFAAPERFPNRRDRDAAARVFAVMTGSPEMVAGPGRFTTRLMEVGGGTLLGKEGADGFYALALRDPEPLGVTIKIADGSERCRDGVVLDVLRQLRALTPDQLEALSEFRTVDRYDRRQRRIGEIVPEVTLGRPR